MAASLQDVREGFLCPICVKDLGSFHKLQNHFESTHSAEDKAVFEQVKGRLLTLYFFIFAVKIVASEFSGIDIFPSV